MKKGEVVAEFDRQYMMNRLDDYRASVGPDRGEHPKAEGGTRGRPECACADDRECQGGSRKSAAGCEDDSGARRIDAERIKLAAEEAEARYKQFLAEVKFVEIGQQSQIKNAELEAPAGASGIEARRSQRRPHADQSADRWPGRDADDVPRHRVRADPAGRSALSRA